MGHFWSCIGKNRKEDFNGKTERDGAYGDDSECSKFDEDQGQENGRFMPDQDFDELLSTFEDALTWPKRHTSFPNSACIESLNALLCMTTSTMSRLATEGRFDEADEVAEAFLELPHVWGEGVFETLRITFFNREKISLGRFVATAGQYLKPEPLQENGDESTDKLYFFTVFDSHLEKYKCTYHLECCYCEGMAKAVYILKLKPRREGLEVKTYGKTRPSYWDVRQDFLQDFARRKRSIVCK